MANENYFAIDINSICNFFGNGMCKILSEFHSITGCDTASYPFGVEKRIPFKKMRRLSKMHLLYGKKNIYSLKRSDKPKLFFQTILYSGKENKTFVSTRKQLYENQKYKTVPNWYLILIVQMIIWNGKIYKHFGDSASRASYGGHHLMCDFDLIRRDLVLETSRNKFSYLYHFIITSIQKFL